MDKAETSEPPSLSFLDVDGGGRIAYAYSRGDSPTVVFLSGYASDMSGTKARFLETHCRQRKLAYLRFDYQGHGASSGKFEEGSIGLWSANARSVIEAVTAGPLLLVGSSMGAWIMLLTALTLRQRVAGLLGIASAPDFSEDLIRPALTPVQLAKLECDGVLTLPSRYSESPQVVSARFLDDGRDHLLLKKSIALDCPIRLVHGLEDPDVPWKTSLCLAERLQSRDVQLTLVKGGDHRLSSHDQLDHIAAVLDDLINRIKRNA